MFFLSMLAILQMLFFPGLIFRALYQPKGKFFFQLSVIVATSMLVNFLVFYPLIYLHWYTRPVVLVIIALEVVALLWLYRRLFRTSLDELGSKLQGWLDDVKAGLTSWFKAESPSLFISILRGLVIAVFLALALSLVLWFFRRLTNNFGTVFNTWDAVLSWNAWAQSWAQGIVPKIHLTYPQLLPINLSLTYLLIGNFQVSVFAKAVMPIFALLTVLTLLELAITEKKYGYLIAVVLVYLLYKKFLSDIITDGYADLPVAFMGWIALIPYLRNEDVLADRKEFILGMILAAAAGLTKQVGLYILAVLPLMAFLNSSLKSKKMFRFVLVVLALGIVAVLPWYLPRGIDVLRGVQSAGVDLYVAHSTSVQNNGSLLMRPVLAMLSLGKYLAFYAFALVALFLLKRRWRLLILLFLLPFSLLWGAVVSYSVRNLSLTFPALAVIVGLAAAVCLDFGWRLLARIKAGKLSAAFLLLVVIAPILYYGFTLSDEAIITKWRDNQSQIFSPEIDEQIYALDFSRDNCHSILTNFPVRFLPGMEDRQVNFSFNDLGMYQKFTADPTICWILVPGSLSIGEVEDDIAAKLANGTYKLLFDTNKWVPYQLIQIR
jgi:hypothetical protein